MINRMPMGNSFFIGLKLAFKIIIVLMSIIGGLQLAFAVSDQPEIPLEAPPPADLAGHV